MPQKNNKETETLALFAAQALDEKKGEDIRVLDLRGVHGAPAEYFVIASGNVPSHVAALCDSVFEKVKKVFGYNPHRVEGYQNAEWILMDYFDVVIHLFEKSKRTHYHLDELWSDAREVATKRQEQPRDL